MTSPTKYVRPLSPFMSYRWQYTMALSFLHRMTGCAMSVGLLFLTYWLVAAATGADAYAKAQQCFANPFVRLLLIAFSFSFFYHLLNGVRHLVWDVGHGFEKKTARMSGWIAFLGGVILTAYFWYLILARVNGGAA